MKRQFMGSLVVLLVAVVVLCNCIALAGAVATSAKETFFGNWVVSKVVVSVPGAALSAKEKKAYLGKTLILKARSSMFSKYNLDAPTYEISEFTGSDFTSSWGMPAKKLGFGTKVTMIEVYSGSGMNAELWKPIGTLFIKNKNALIMAVEGTFFELIRKK